MCWKVILLRIGCMMLLFEPSQQQSKQKRSPLEIGYVQFTLPHNYHDHIMVHPNTIQQSPNNTIMTVTQEMINNKAEAAGQIRNHHLLIATSPAVTYIHRWIPGHVHNHAFIPGRVVHHHVLVPATGTTGNAGEHLLVAHDGHGPVLLQPTLSIYRKHYGGFGVGLDYGGQGAGHGFHVL